MNRKEIKLKKLENRYLNDNDLIISRVARKTIRYIEKNTENFPNKYIILKNKIVNCCYSILENIYRANIFQDINDKKEIVVNIQMLNFYLEEALKKELISKKKFINYINYLIEIDNMTRSWFKYETIK